MARDLLPRQIEQKIKDEDLDFDTLLEIAQVHGPNGLQRPAEETAKKPKEPKKPTYILMENIEEEDIDYLWINRIPRGKITLFSGDPGSGKSHVASMIAATISRADALPFDKGSEVPLRTMIISTEDTAPDILRPRLGRMKADLSMIAIPDPSHFPSPDAIVNNIEEIISSFKPDLLVFDPIIAYTGGRNTDKASTVRDFLTPIQALAVKYKIAIIMILHLSKEKTMSALYRSQGSIDWNAVARSAFVFAEDKNDPERHMMAHVKGSITKRQSTIEYFIEGQDGQFRWGLETSDTADDVLQHKTVQDPAKAERRLFELIVSGIEPENELRDKMEAEGFDKNAFWAAAQKLKQQGKATSKRERETGAWLWRPL